MKAEYVNPFYQATIQVFKLMLELDVGRGDAPLQKSEPLIEVLISITGDLSGTVLYQFPQSMTLEMVRIMSGLEIDSPDSFVTSALAEVANIISGNAVSGLLQQNYQCDISTPRVLVGESAEYVDLSGRILSLPLSTPIGNPMIKITLEETPS